MFAPNFICAESHRRNAHRLANIGHAAAFKSADRKLLRVADGARKRYRRCSSGIGAPAHDLGTVLDEADVREEFIMRQGLIPVRSPPPDELRRFVAGEIVRLGDIVRKTGLAGSE